MTRYFARGSAWRPSCCRAESKEAGTDEVEIFEPGKHTAASGAVLPFGADEIEGAAAAYVPARHEAPVVVGHPGHDRPAYGWVKALKGGRRPPGRRARPG